MSYLFKIDIFNLPFSYQLHGQNHESLVQLVMELVLGPRVIGESIIGAKLDYEGRSQMKFHLCFALSS